jgi:outer membrane protein
MNFHKKLIFFFTFLLFSVQVSAENNIAYVDVDKILTISKVGKSIISQLEKIQKNTLEELKKNGDKLKSEETEIIAKKNILSKEDFQKEVNKLKQKVKQFAQIRSDKLKNLQEKKLNATAKVLDSLNPILLNYANKNSIAVILQKKNIVMGKKELDITDQILSIVNKEIKIFTLK